MKCKFPHPQVKSLEYRLTRLLTQFLAAAFAYKPGSYSCNRDRMAHKASDIYSPPFTESVLLTSTLLTGCSEHYNEFANML